MEYKEFRMIIDNSSHLRIFKPNGRSIPGTVRIDPLRQRIINIFSGWLADGKITRREELVILGSCLYEILFDAEISKEFKSEFDRLQTQPSTVLRLMLEFETTARELAELPWEYIYYPDSGREKGFFLAQRGRLILARHVPLNEDFNMEPDKKPLRILFVVSRPQDLGPVRAEPTIQVVEGLKNRLPDSIVIDTLDQPTKRSLTEKIGEFRPHVLHFIGHGRYSQLGLLNDDLRTVAWISDVDLGDCFLEYQPRLIFLQACEGAHTESYETFKGVALQLVYSRVSAVVAMQYQVENKVANSFARTFYESLGEGKPIDAAVQAGRLELGNYLDEGQNWSSRAFGSPVLYLQSTQGIIFADAQIEREAVQQPSSTPNIVLCPKCFTRIASTSKFCSDCREPLMLCPECKQIMRKNAFCSNCGYGGEQQTTANAESSPVGRDALIRG